jgi:adenylate kinase
LRLTGISQNKFFTLVAMAAITDLFSPGGGPAKTKIIILGSPDFRSEKLMNLSRSLHIEHVSPVGLIRREISRRPGSAGAEESTTIAAMRKWFFTRKPDAGFVLTDFPATLLQALVFDEWLDARDETIVAALAFHGSPEPVLDHYRTLGLLINGADLAA